MYWFQQVRVDHVKTLAIETFVDDLDLLLSELLIKLMGLGIEHYLLHLLRSFLPLNQLGFQALQLKLALVRQAVVGGGVVAC